MSFNVWNGTAFNLNSSKWGRFNFLNKVKGNGRKLTILCSLTFQRGLYFGTSHNGIEDQQYETQRQI